MLVGLLIVGLVVGLVLVVRRRNASRDAAFVASIDTVVFEDEGCTIAIGFGRLKQPL